MLPEWTAGLRVVLREIRKEMKDASKQSNPDAMPLVKRPRRSSPVKSTYGFRDIMVSLGTVDD